MREALNGIGAAGRALKQINPEVVVSLPSDSMNEICKGFDFIPDAEEDVIDSGETLLSTSMKLAQGKRTFLSVSAKSLSGLEPSLKRVSLSRIPLVMHVGCGNPSCDHESVMSVRSQGWIQLFCETAQEVYDLTFIGLKIAEKALLPVMICQDFSSTTHAIEPVELHDMKKVKDFIGVKPKKSMLMKFWPFQTQTMETGEQHIKTLGLAFDSYQKVTNEYYKLFMRYPPLEEYKTLDADIVLIVLGSSAGVVKDVVDELRDKGTRVGCLKIRMFRPFPYKLVSEALRNAKGVAVMDRCISYGSMPPLFSEVKHCFVGSMQSYLYGLGTSLTKHQVHEVFSELEKKLWKELVM